MASKQFKLRAFKVENSIPTRAESTVMTLLIQRLEETIANDRRMSLNENDVVEDLFCNYEITSERYVWGSSLRIAPSEDVLDIPDELFDEQRIELQELDSLRDSGKLIYKSHFYFMVSNKWLITTLPGHTTIDRFQTYINWFLGPLRGPEIFEFTPHIKEAPYYQLKNIRTIKVKDPIVQNNSQESVSNERKKVSLSMLKNLLSDVESLEETSLEEIISAELLLKFKKPRSMSKEEYQSALGAYLKPISDVDNVSFQSKNGENIKGTEIVNIKTINVEKLESNKISEQELKIEMEQFLNELG